MDYDVHILDLHDFRAPNHQHMHLVRLETPNPPDLHPGQSADGRRALRTQIDGPYLLLPSKRPVVADDDPLIELPPAPGLDLGAGEAPRQAGVNELLPGGDADLVSKWKRLRSEHAAMVTRTVLCAL